MSAGRQHSEWLSLVEISGPFLTLPVLRRTFPHGLDPTDIDLARQLRDAYNEWSDDPALQPRWIRWVLKHLLSHTESLAEGATLAGFTHRVSEHGIGLRPDLAIIDPGSSPVRARVLVMEWPSRTQLHQRTDDSRWAASPIDRIAELCHGAGVRIGLVTNGETWILVDAPEGGAVGTCTWDAALWLEERTTLDAFTSLLGPKRFFGVDEDDTLERLLDKSADAEVEVTDQLGRQVRAAVELLVDAMSRANREQKGRVFKGVDATEVYQGSVTVMMRLVFLLSAEERDLFLLGDETYDNTYAVSTLRGQLEDEAQSYGEDVLERRTDAWGRLLATFRMVYAGTNHENLRLPAYGGSLFDPDRFPFLEGRAGGNGKEASLPIDNRTVLHILDALQVLRFSGRGGVKEARRISFLSLDVEQIGHVYEGLLDHSCIPTDRVVLALDGKNEPEIALEEIRKREEIGRSEFVAWLAEETGLSQSRIEKAIDSEPEQDDRDRLMSACDNDDELTEEVMPFLQLLRRDLRGLPTVILPKSLYVTQSSDRRSSGTYYTPRALAEELVSHTLEPLVYSPGPAEGAPPEEWKLKSTQKIIELKICDMAMGSGAFLVAACRFLSDRLLEAWSAEGLKPRASISLHDGGTITMPDELSDREILARRLVADRCLFGVDRNPMAVEMAKLSLWLITLAKDRPFTFIDHALRCGDSLLGITTLEQLDSFHLDPAAGRKLHGGTLLDPTKWIQPLVKQALEKRRQLESFSVVDVRDAERKYKLLEEADALLEGLKVVADLILGAALSTAMKGAEAYDDRLRLIADDLMHALDPTLDVDERRKRVLDLKSTGAYWLNQDRPDDAPERSCLHWALEFPEIFTSTQGCFDAILGNPPFLGGVSMGAVFGSDYERYLKRRTAEAKGFVDLAVYFHRRALELTDGESLIGLLGPQNLTATQNRKASIDVAVSVGRQIIWARDHMPWPGNASTEVCSICYAGDARQAGGPNDQSVDSIAADLAGSTNVGQAYRLRPLIPYTQGTDLYGSSFVKPENEWMDFVRDCPRLHDFLRVYVNADILCSYPDSKSDLLVVDFGEMEREELVNLGLGRVIDHLEKTVGEERSNQTKQIHEYRPWLFWDKRTAAYADARGLSRVIVCPNLSKFVPMVFVDPSHLFSKATKLFITDDPGHFGVLQSSLFLAWVVATSPTRGWRISFSTRNSFDTFPPPDITEEISHLGETLAGLRVETQAERQEGITNLINSLHSPDEKGADIQDLRELQQHLDNTVAAAYGWSDLDLDHSFHETRQGVRYTFAPAARTEILVRLLELNYTRYEEEIMQGLHKDLKVDRNAGSRKRSKRVAGSSTSQLWTPEEAKS